MTRGLDEIGLHGSRFNPHCLIRPSKIEPDVGEIPEIGEGTWIGPFTLIDGSGGLVIGKGCDISSGVQIVTHSTVMRCISEGHYGVQYSPVWIGDHVFIGTSATILMGSRIGHHSVVAAGSVVRERTLASPWSLIKGNPAKVIAGWAKKYKGIN